MLLHYNTEVEVPFAGVSPVEVAALSEELPLSERIPEA
jgi:hypothetical protein